MTLLFISILAGMLSVLAPCIVSMLPIVLTRSADSKNARRPFYVISGLLISIFVFSILLKSSTLLIKVPQDVWQWLSGVIILCFGIFSLFPKLWEFISGFLHLQQRAQENSGKALQKRGIAGDLLLGASLGPVFSACSPTYALIVASILPVEPLRGVLYLVAFLLGLGVMLTIITIYGGKAIYRLGWGINPNGWFKRGLGVIFIILGLLLLTGYDKKIQTWTVDQGWFDWQVNLESKLQ